MGETEEEGWAGGDAIQAEDGREARGGKHRNSLAHPGRLSLGGGSLASSRRLRERWSVLDQERDVKEAELWEGWGRKPLEAQPHCHDGGASVFANVLQKDRPRSPVRF